MKDNDEAAFPFEFDHRDEADGPVERISHPGMSLRDWFAGQVVSSIYAGASNNQTFAGIAMEAFRLADAMLAERERK